MKTMPMTRSRSLFAIAMIVGALVGMAAYVYGAAGDRTPTARVQMVLDEDQTGWPFYAAVQEEASALVNDATLLDGARSQAGVTSGELNVDRPGDLSIFSLVATDSRPASAIALADAGAAELIARSQESRQATERIDLSVLQDRATALESELSTASSALDNVGDEASSTADAVIARTAVETTSRELNDVNREINDLTSEIDRIGPAFRALGPAELDSNTTSTLLTALTAGAAAAVLSLLALSFIGQPEGLQPVEHLPDAKKEPVTATRPTRPPARRNDPPKRSR